MKILVVFDERGIADYIADTLRKQEYQTLALYTTADGIEHLKHLWFDLVILDRSSAVLAEQILGDLIHPEIMLLDAQDTLDGLPSKVKEVEQRLELEWQQALEFLQSGY